MQNGLARQNWLEHARPTRHTGPKSHEGNRINWVLQIDGAAKVTGNITWLLKGQFQHVSFLFHIFIFPI